MASVLLAVFGCVAAAKQEKAKGSDTAPAEYQSENGEMFEMSEQVVAQIILRIREGRSILGADEPITSKTVGKYQVEESVVQDARKKLAAYGFAIGLGGPHGFSISGDKALFERIFHTQLQPSNQFGTEHGSRAGKGASYEAKAPMVIPEDLSGSVAGIVLPVRPELYP